MTPLALALLSLVTQDPVPGGRPTPTPPQEAGAASRPAAETQPTRLPAELRRALVEGLRWLGEQQAEDGRWTRIDGPGSEPPQADGLDLGITGLAVLAIRACPQELGAMHEGQAGKAMAWLTEQCDEKGYLGPRIGLQAYNQAIGTMALLSERKPSGEAAARQQTAKAVACIHKWRNPYKVWRYMPRDGDNDSSVTGWMSLALIKARSRGFEIDRRAFPSVLAWYDEVTDPATGRVGYTRRGEGSSRDQDAGAAFPTKSTEAMTALSLLVRARLGKKLEDCKESARLVAELKPVWTPEKGNVDLYYWLYASLALQALEHPEAQAWNRELRTALLQGQIREGKDRGSWPPVDPWSRFGGRVFTTSMAMLCLQASTGQAVL